MLWLKLAWGVISGNLSSIVSTITGYLGKLSDNQTAQLQSAIGADKDVAIAQLQASAASYHDRVDILKGMKATQWLIIAALFPPLLHQGAIFLDSTPFPFFWDWAFQIHTQGSWGVFKVPAPYDDREWQLIASLLGIQSAMTVGLGITKVLLRK